jgi:hypothetical protein
VPPKDVIHAAHAVLGSVDLDPYSTAEANRLVTAKAFFDRNSHDIDDVLSLAWDTHPNCRVFLGVPSGASMTRRLLDKLQSEYQRNRVQQAVVWIGANEAITRTPWIWDFPLCFPFRRLRPCYWDDELDELRPVAPAHWSAILYLPPKGCTELFFQSVSRFSVAFSPVGRVVVNDWSGAEWEHAYAKLFGRPYLHHP